MAVWRYYDANLGVHAFRWDTDLFNINIRDRSIVLRYDEGLGRAFEGERNAWKIVFDLSDPETFVPQEGPNKGVEQFSGGSLTGIRMYSQTGDLQIKVGQIDVPLVAVQSWYNEGGAYDGVFQYLDTFSATYIGANNGPKSGWDDYILRDDIRTGMGNDIVKANGGNDYIKDFGGEDAYFGGAGRDQLSYDEWFWNPTGTVTGIRADLRDGKIEGPDGDTDTVQGIEEVRGTFLRDVLRGDAKDNGFQGMGGNDLIVGRGGWDEVSYRNEDNQGGTAGIRADMKAGKIRDGFGNTDTIKSIEGVRGTDVRDIFSDDGKDHSYIGRKGNDTFKIEGGNDWMRGDGGADRFVFIGNAFGSNTVADFDPDAGDTLIIQEAGRPRDLEILSQNGGADTLVRFNADSEIFLQGIDAASVDRGDFIA